MRLVVISSALASTASTAFAFGPFIDQSGGAFVDGPDGVAAFTADVQSSAAIFDSLIVELDFQHTWAGDLTVTLEHDGVSVTLLERLGVPEGAFGNGADFNGVYTFAAGGASWAPHDVAQPGVGEVIPAGVFGVDNSDGSSLADFIGGDINGEWTLTITDAAQFDSGGLFSWRVRIVPAPSGAGFFALGALTLARRRR